MRVQRPRLGPLRLRRNDRPRSRQTVPNLKNQLMKGKATRQTKRLPEQSLLLLNRIPIKQTGRTINLNNPQQGGKGLHRLRRGSQRRTRSLVKVIILQPHRNRNLLPRRRKLPHRRRQRKPLPILKVKGNLAKNRRRQRHRRPHHSLPHLESKILAIVTVHQRRRHPHQQRSQPRKQTLAKESRNGRKKVRTIQRALRRTDQPPFQGNHSHNPKPRKHQASKESDPTATVRMKVVRGTLHLYTLPIDGSLMEVRLKQLDGSHRRSLLQLGISPISLL